MDFWHDAAAQKRWLRRFALLTGVLLLPVLVLAVFARPSADDFIYAARSGTAAQTAGGKAASNGASAARSGMEQAVEKGKTAVSTAVNGIANFAKSNAHVLVIVGVFLLLLLLVMSAFSSCSILFSGTTQVSGQTIYTAEDRDIRGAETDYKKLEKELDKKIKRTPTDLAARKLTPDAPNIWCFSYRRSLR